uniref:Uncharacterized protein n=1 Tax=Plectus sambesii TaxID=2011161 RepID=A0A914XDI8_9BILA
MLTQKQKETQEKWALQRKNNVWNQTVEYYEDNLQADWCSGLKNHHSSLTSLEDAGSIPAEGGPSPNQSVHPSVGRGIGSSYAAVVST